MLESWYFQEMICKILYWDKYILFQCVCSNTGINKINYFFQLAEEKISNIKTVKAFSKEEKECASYGQRIENLLNLAYKESLAVGSFYGLVNIHYLIFCIFLRVTFYVNSWSKQSHQDRSSWLEADHMYAGAQCSKTSWGLGVDGPYTLSGQTTVAILNLTDKVYLVRDLFAEFWIRFWYTLNLKMFVL